MSQPVSRLGRVLDLVALVLLVAAAGTYFYAYTGLQALRTTQPGVEGGKFAAMTEYAHLLQISRVGVSIGVLGVGVVITAFALNRWKRGPNAPLPG